MQSVTVEEAASLLPQLILVARSGEEVIITQNSLPIAKLVSAVPAKPNRQPGSAKGLILHIAEDFDAIPDGFEDYIP